MHLGGVSARTDRPALCIFPVASAHFVQRQMAATAWQVWMMGPIYEGMRTMDFKLISLLAEVTRTRKEKQDWS